MRRRRSRRSTASIPVLPLSPGRAERHGFEYYRHGTLSLFAALEHAVGRSARARPCPGTPARRSSSSSARSWPRNRSDGDPRDCRQSVDPQDAGGADVSARASRTCSCISRRRILVLAESGRTLVLRRSNATSSRAASLRPCADLARKIRRYIRHYNKAPKPIRWSYRNPAHRISSTSATGHEDGLDSLKQDLVCLAPYGAEIDDR